MFSFFSDELTIFFGTFWDKRHRQQLCSFLHHYTRGTQHSKHSTPLSPFLSLSLGESVRAAAFSCGFERGATTLGMTTFSRMSFWIMTLNTLFALRNIKVSLHNITLATCGYYYQSVTCKLMLGWVLLCWMLLCLMSLRCMALYRMSVCWVLLC